MSGTMIHGVGRHVMPASRFGATTSYPARSGVVFSQTVVDQLPLRHAMRVPAVVTYGGSSSSSSSNSSSVSTDFRGRSAGPGIGIFTQGKNMAFAPPNRRIVLGSSKMIVSCKVAGTVRLVCSWGKVDFQKVAPPAMGTDEWQARANIRESLFYHEVASAQRPADVVDMISSLSQHFFFLTTKSCQHLMHHFRNVLIIELFIHNCLSADILYFECSKA